MKETENHSAFGANEINLGYLIRQVIRKKRLIIFIALGITFLGFLHALFSSSEWTSYSKLLPESNSSNKNLSGLGGLAGLAGINLDLSPGSGLPPTLYPEIAYSKPFLMKLANEPIYFERIGSSLSCMEYYQNYYEPPIFKVIIGFVMKLPSKLKSIFTGSKSNEITETGSQKSTILRLDEEEEIALLMVQESFGVFYNEETGLLIVTTTMPDPMASAQFTAKIVEMLKMEVSIYKTKKSQQELDFIEESFSAARERFVFTQKALAEYKDKNQNFNRSSAQLRQQTLQNEYDIAFEVYKSLASQLEQAKIRVSENTPAFSILEPVSYPNNRSAPKRMVILLSYIIAGVVIGLSVVIAKELSLSFLHTLKVNEASSTK